MINNPEKFPPGEQTLILQGPAGELETMISTPRYHTKAVTVVICHPHPLFGGTMQNKVVYTLSRTFNDAGMHTVRFNFRGVGKSTGNYAEGIGETDDLIAVLEWVQQMRPEDDIWLAGFSFGSYVAARGSHRWPVKQLICVAPPIGRFEFAAQYPFPCPTLIIQGEQDEVVPPENVFNWHASLADPPPLIRMPDTGHFFHSKLVDLKNILLNTLKIN